MLNEQILREIQQGLRTGIHNGRVFSTAQALDALVTHLIDTLPKPKTNEQPQQGKGR